MRRLLSLFSRFAYGITIPGICLILCACTTASVLTQQADEIFSSVPASRHAKVAVFVNWSDSCYEQPCESDRLAKQVAITQCIDAAFRTISPGIEAVNVGQLLQQDTSALVEDPRTIGAADLRFTGPIALRLTAETAPYALVVDITTSTRGGGDRFSGGYDVAGEFTHVTIQRVYTRIEGLLVDVSSGEWLARVQRTFAGSAETAVGAAIAMVVPIPFVYVRFPSTEEAACTALGKAIASELFQGARANRIRGQADRADERQHLFLRMSALGR